MSSDNGLFWLDADSRQGMIAGLIIKLTEGNFIQSTVSFNESFFFNLILPPIILASGYELHQVSHASSAAESAFNR